MSLLLSLLFVTALPGCGPKQVETNPTTTAADPASLFSSGVSTLQAESPDYQKALGYFEAATTADASMVKAWYNAGFCAQRLGDNSKAEQYYRKALELDPNLTGAIFNLGEVLKSANRASEAVTLYQNYLQAHPGDLKAMNNLVDALTAAKQYEAAIAEAQEVLALDPKNVGAYRNMSRAYLEQGNYSMSLLAGEKDGSDVRSSLGEPPRTLRIVLQSVRDASGETLKGIAVTVQDLTREVELNAAQSRFISNVSHELRTPLFNIKSYVETLHDYDDQLSGEQKQEFLAIANAETDRLTRLVNDVLDLSRLESDRVWELEPLEVGPAIEQTLRTYRLNARDKGVELGFEGRRGAEQPRSSRKVAVCCAGEEVGEELPLALDLLVDGADRERARDLVGRHATPLPVDAEALPRRTPRPTAREVHGDRVAEEQHLGRVRHARHRGRHAEQLHEHRIGALREQRPRAGLEIGRAIERHLRRLRRQHAEPRLQP
mgnify:CR=1 FL=1